jgi:glycosyltransferase involved in cell wall biosynthesis
MRDATVIPHGIERVEPVDRDEARAALGLDDRLVALCFGFLAPYKGLETALEAGSQAGDDVLVVVAGDDHPRLAANGDDYADRLRGRYASTARFTGWVPGEDVVPWFSAADVAVFPYPQPFSSSGALALALACDTPILLSAPLGRCVGAPSDIVFATEDDLRDRLAALAGDRRAVDDLRTWTSCLADGRAWSDVADRHLELYGQVRP